MSELTKSDWDRYMEKVFTKSDSDHKLDRVEIEDGVVYVFNKDNKCIAYMSEDCYNTIITHFQSHTNPPSTIPNNPPA